MGNDQRDLEVADLASVLVVPVGHFVAGGLDEDKLGLGVLVLDEWLHADDIHVVLLVVGQQIVVQLQR